MLPVFRKNPAAISVIRTEKRKTTNACVSRIFYHAAYFSFRLAILRLQRKNSLIFSLLPLVLLTLQTLFCLNYGTSLQSPWLYLALLYCSGYSCKVYYAMVCIMGGAKLHENVYYSHEVTRRKCTSFPIMLACASWSHCSACCAVLVIPT